MRKLVPALLAVSLWAQNDVAQWMKRGTEAFKDARYAEAADAFAKAVKLDPTNPQAFFLLGTAYYVQYIPGAETPDNTALAVKAEASFRKVLELDPASRDATAYLAGLFFQQASATASLAEKSVRLKNAADWYQKLADLDPMDKEAFYTLGVIDWLRAYPQWSAARAEAGLKPADRGPLPSPLREAMQADAGYLFEDGERQLRRALELDPQYDDAMAYMNLITRESADLVDSPAEYQRRINTADQWVQKALDAKKAKAEAATAHAIQ